MSIEQATSQARARALDSAPRPRVPRAIAPASRSPHAPAVTETTILRGRVTAWARERERENECWLSVQHKRKLKRTHLADRAPGNRVYSVCAQG